MGGMLVFQISAFGDQGMRIQFGNRISMETNQMIRSFSILLHQENIEGVREWIPTYTALTIVYDPYLITYTELKGKILELQDHVFSTDVPAAQVIQIPTCYGGEYGPDLSFVASYNGLDERQVMDIHSSTKYLIYMMGFTAGFPYLGGMSPKIATPRQPVPRTKIAAGSVGIAGEQTGIYPLDTPGGWQIIGRTPLKLFNPLNPSPILLEAGNYIQFMPITKEQFIKIEQEIEVGTYKIEKKKFVMLEESDVL